MDGICVVLDRRNEWRERLWWGLLVVIIVDVEVGDGKNIVSLFCGGCCCIGRVEGLIAGFDGGFAGAGNDVSRDDVSWRILGLL